MSCNPCQKNVFSIFQGDNKTMPLKAVYSESGDPLDLTSCTEIVVSLPNEDGTLSTFKLSLSTVTITSPATIGKFSILVTTVISNLLNLGELQNFDVTFTISGQIFTVRYLNALSVLESP
jgi:hypothetical protein